MISWHGIFRNVYERSPAFLKRAVCSVPYEVLAGGEYRRTKAVVSSMESAPSEVISVFRMAKLRELIEYSVAEVPRYSGFGAVLKEQNPLRALRLLPIIRKQEVLSNPQLFTSASAVSIPHRIGSTGGSSGEQLRFLDDQRSHIREMAHFHVMWARVGYRPRFRKATFRGVAFPNACKGEYWQRNPVFNEMQFSPFHMSQDRLALYLKILEKWDPHFIHGYPSAVEVLARYVLRTGNRGFLGRLKSVLLGAEAFSPAQLAAIDDACGARVLSWYGQI